MTETMSSPAESSTDPSPPRPDYSFWTAEALERFPNYVVYPSKRETTGVWCHGYRMRDLRVTPPKPLWLCCICCSRQTPSPHLYTLLGVNTASIRKHMRCQHGVEVTKRVVKRGRSEVDVDEPEKRRRETPEQTIPSPPSPSQPVLRQPVPSQPISSQPIPSQPISSEQGRTLQKFLVIRDANPDRKVILDQKDEKKNQVLLLDWITHHNLPFSIVQSEQFKRLLMYNNTSLREEQIPSADALIRVLDAEYNRALVSVREVLQNARSRIHYTLDGYTDTSQHSTSYSGVNAHFIDENWHQWNIPLAMPAQIGRRTGDALTDEIAATLNSLEIRDSIGYFTVENASKNDTVVTALGREFEFDPSERQIRCAPHFLNLVTRTMMYGTMKNDFIQLIMEWTDSNYHDEKQLQQLVDALDGLYCLEDAEEQSPAAELEDTKDDSTYPIPSELSTEEIGKYKKTGPFGKLYNIGIHMRYSSQIREAFVSAQRQINSPDESILNFIQNNDSSKWQSDEGMVSRALSRRRALSRMFSNLEQSWLSQGGQPESKPSILNEKLSPSEWQIVHILWRILQLFKLASKQLQRVAEGGSTCVGFCDYFPVIEMLLDHLEAVSQGYIVEEDDDDQLVRKPLFDAVNQETRFFLLIYVKLGLKKLEDYYSKLTSAAYVGAVVFHPCKKWAALGELWGQSPTRQAANWKRDYENRLVSIWESSYKSTLDIGEGASEIKYEAAEIIGRRLAFRRSFSGVSRQPSEERSSDQETKTANGTSTHSELEIYLSEPPIDTATYEEDPIAWWRDIGSSQFPRLSYMAVDFLTIPSSSVAAGRDFSTGEMIASPRTRLRRHVIGMARCLQSWGKAGIYQPTLPLGMLESGNWRETLLSATRNCSDRRECEV